jgi:hypothetical protein
MRGWEMKEGNMHLHLCLLVHGTNLVILRVGHGGLKETYLLSSFPFSDKTMYHTFIFAWWYREEIWCFLRAVLSGWGPASSRNLAS